MQDQFPVVPTTPAASLVTLTDGEPRTTSTLMIAEGTENEHASVINLVRKYQSDLAEFGHVDFKSTWVQRPQGGGSSTEYATLNEGQATLLLTYMRNSDIVREFKKRLVRDFLSYKQQASQNPATMSRMQLLQMAMQAEEERMALEHKVDELAPKAQALERLSGADGCFSLRDSAKALKMAERKFIDWLQVSMRWLYRDQKGRLRGRSEVTPKFVKHRVTPIPTEEDADRVSMQPLITAIGLTRLAEILNVEIETGLFA